MTNLIKKKILLLPGTGQGVNNYKNYNGLEIWMNTKLENESLDADFLIGHSLGANFALAYNQNPNCKFIIINPLICKKSFARLILRWMKFMFYEGFEIKKAVPLKYWFYVFRKMLNLIKIDVLDSIKKIPRDNIFIIRGKKDNFFCDNEAVKIIKKNKFKLLEVEAGHDWNKNIAKTVKEIIQAQII